MKVISVNGKVLLANGKAVKPPAGGGGKATVETFCMDNIANQFLSDTWSPSTGAELFRVGKYSYNGVILPGFPANAMGGYPYAFIRKGDTRYNLVFSKTPYYFAAASNDKPDRLDANIESVANYLLNYADLESATEWNFRNNDAYYFAVNGVSSILWSNYDIPNGSATATEIYFEGSEPVLAE